MLNHSSFYDKHTTAHSGHNSIARYRAYYSYST